MAFIEMSAIFYNTRLYNPSCLNFYHYMKGQKEKEVRKPQVFISFLG